MGIEVEFNPDLALRKFKTSGRHPEECLPEKLEAGQIYPFLKTGQRLYWLNDEIPLYETEGNGRFSRPLASIIIVTATHYKVREKTLTKGTYQVQTVFDPDEKTIHFEGLKRIS